MSSCTKCGKNLLSDGKCSNFNCKEEEASIIQLAFPMNGLVTGRMHNTTLNKVNPELASILELPKDFKISTYDFVGAGKELLDSLVKEYVLKDLHDICDTS